MKVIGLDVGEKRIGVSKADSDTRIALPVGFIDVNGTEWQEIARISRMNNTKFFVLGLPRSNEGNETAQSLYVRKFAEVLTEKIPGAKIRFQDESLTSVLAEERLKKRRKRYEKGEIDAEAAAIILQDFMENLKASPSTLPDSVNERERLSEAIVGVKAAMTEAKETMTNVTKKEADKVKLNTKKVKHKMKTATKWTTMVIILVILGLIGTGIALFIREKNHQEYLAWVKEQEEKMVAEVFNFTILPGETIYEIKRNLAEIGYSNDEIDEAFEANYDFSFLKERPEGATLEGYLYGETHEFYATATVKEILETFLGGMEKVINENDLEAKYAEKGLTLFEGITLASIVQKEAPSPEQPTVAQVFLSRLNYGVPLGSDVTVSYALDTIDPKREVYSDNQAALTVDSCYNTRVNAGLPCGPISNPGISALLAVAEPSDTSYLYFLTGDDGMMYYSYTESEHIQNIYSHCQVLCNVSL